MNSQPSLRSPSGRADDGARPAVGHLRVRIEGQHPEDVAFLFERGRRRVPGAAALSVAAHVAALAFIVFGLRYHAASPANSGDLTAIRPLPSNIVFVAAAGPGGGGGGGGEGTKAPARKAEMPGRDNTTLPVAKRAPIVLTATTTPRNDPPIPAIPQLSIDALATASGVQAVVGTLDGVTGGTSRGPGAGRGAGGGNGDGIGPGIGDGLGDGAGGNTGGDLVQPGNGVEDPQPVYTPKPEYTAEALKAKIQGTAIVECVVTAEGTVSRPHLVSSLDPRFGLDVEALKAASKWRFVPARRRGQPVAMLVAIYLTFSLR